VTSPSRFVATTARTREVRATAVLAGPVILAEIGWITMGLVDVVAVSHAFGGRRMDECHRWLSSGLWTAVALSAVLVVVGVLIVAGLSRWGMDADVEALMAPYLSRLVWSTLPLLIYTVLRRYLQALAIVKPVMVAVVAANIVNAAANWAFIYGHWGAPAMGVAGAAWATLASRTLLASWLLIVVIVAERDKGSRWADFSWRPDFNRIRRIIAHGLPAAGQIVLEVGAFALAAIFTARISAAAAGAHQIVMQIAGFFFMIPLGLGSAAAVRVGHAVGRRDPVGARMAGWVAIGLTGIAALLCSSLMAGAPGFLLGTFTDDATVLGIGATVLLIWAVFQPFDALQTVGIGALRGLGDTRTPMFVHLAAHYVIGLPLGWLLAFPMGRGVVGLWIGLSAGLLVAGVSVLLVWRARSRALV
jgi:MATE family multidrug resistance protein